MTYLRSVTGKIKAILTPDMRQSKTQQSVNADQKSLETVFSIRAKNGNRKLCF